MKRNLRKSVLLERESDRAAFTLTELLVILGVVGLLVCFQMAAFAGTKGRTRIAQCATHLRQFALALQIYAHENHDKLPSVPNPAGVWPWDTDIRVTDAIAPYGATRNILYCPANVEWNNDNTWNFEPNVFRILGYVAALPVTPQLPAGLVNWTLTPQSYQGSAAPLPSQRVLLADVTVRDSLTKRFDYISTGGLPRSVSQRTSHLDGQYPAGGNVALLDGHVEWREWPNWTEVFPRTSGSVPLFFW